MQRIALLTLALVALASHARSQAQPTFCRADEAFPSLCPCGSQTWAWPTGCPNSVYPWGTSLTANGNASVSADDMQLQIDGAPVGTQMMLCQGTFGIAPTPFGDGLRCIGGQITRMRVLTPYAGTSYRFYPDVGEPSLSTLGHLPPDGGYRCYQVWYRNAGSFCTPAGFNMTNAVGISWMP